MKAAVFQKFSVVADAFTEFLLYEKKPKGISIESDIEYADMPRSNLDFIYFPKDISEKSVKVFVYIHGGGFVSGDKRMRRYYCYRYAKEGYFVVNVNYDFAQNSPFPGQMRQLFKAIEFIFENKIKYNLDTDKIVLAGESAGACLAAHISAIASNRSLYETIGIDFKYKDEFLPKANVLISGAYNIGELCDNRFPNMREFVVTYSNIEYAELRKNTDNIRLMTPYYHINGNYPPTAIARAKKDHLNPDSIKFIQALEKNNVAFTEFFDDSALSFHAFLLACWSKQGSRCLRQFLSFLEDNGLPR